jgi:branched-chain amino acid transport system ATP-binding protein
MAAELELHGVNLHFGGVTVLNDVGFTVSAGQIFGLVGPNGAGKTSLFNCISGHYRPQSGTITIDGENVAQVPPARMAAHGLARTFQHPALQLQRSVLENVMLGAHSRMSGNPLTWALRGPGARKSEAAVRAEALTILDRNDLAWAADRSAGELSHGLHKSVELCRALMMHPKLLLLDEPAAGLPHSEVEALISTVKRLQAEEDVTVVIVEHHMGLISALTDAVMVLDHGSKLMEGTAAEAQADPRVIEAYIGKADDDAA